ncbi:MAG TPA: right-handed parallel beta-helix repeat-containing protein [Parafilimonas sp.]|nr:right-handed parallel beta-helix repeat-containing protein [Parafilimonas sp.]
MYNNLPMSKTGLLKLAGICFFIFLIALFQKVNAQTRTDKARRPMPEKSALLKRIPPNVKNFTTLDCSNSSPFYVNDNDQTGDVYTTAVGNDANCGTAAAPFATIQFAISIAQPGDVIYVDAGLYPEDVSVIQSVTLVGLDTGKTTIEGPIGGAGSTVAIAANNVDISKFKITRAGNNVADWNDPGTNTAGISVQGAYTGMVIHDNLITQNRTAIDVNNSSNHTIRNNVITDNHTGLIFRNVTDNMTVTENAITVNRTVGVLFLDASGGTNSPLQTALNCTFNNNNISGNWYGQIVDRQQGGSLPTPGTTNLKNFSGNWYGTNQPSVTTANSDEPGYSVLIPAEFGGTDPTSIPPSTPPDEIAGQASANFDYTPYLNTGNDANVETTPGRGTFGFQGTFTNLWVTASGAQTGSSGRIDEGIGLVAGNTLNVTSGAFNENVTVNKSLTLKGANYNVSCSDGRGTESAINGVLASGTAAILIGADNVTINGFTITNPGGSFGIYGYGRSNVKVQNNIITNVGDETTGSQPSYGVAIEIGTTADISNINIAKNCIGDIRGGANTSLSGSAAKANNGSGGGIGVGFSTANHDALNVTISNNIINDITANTADFNDGGKGAYGILINAGASGAAIGKAVNPLVTNNAITNLEGLWAHGVGLEGETPGALVTNNYINGLIDHKGNTDAVGVHIEDNAGAGSVSVHSNSFTSTAFGIKNSTGLAVDASCNWYGSNDATTVASKVDGNVSYIPFLFDGTDANTNVLGFQSVNGACLQPFSLVLASKTDLTCNGDKSGAIDITVSGGSGKYTYAWSNGKTKQDLTSLAAGTYTVTVTDKKFGNTANLSVTLTEPPALVLTLVNKTNVNCFGDASGSFTVAASGGSGGGYLYKVNTGPYTAQDQYTSLIAGSYAVTAQDANGCIKSITVKITQPASALTVVVTDHKDIRCHGNSTGSIKVSATGGTKPYSNYILSGPVNQSNTNGSFKNLPAGDYTISRTDAHGCVASTSLTLTEPETGCNPGILADGDNESLTVKAGSFETMLSPNPAIDEFTLSVKSSSSAPVTIKIVNMAGKVVYNKQAFPNQSYRFGQQFANGVYSIQIIQGSTVKTIKAVKGK